MQKIQDIIRRKKPKFEHEKLRLSLADFGLFPGDWKLSNERNDHYLIINRDSPEFFFKGRTTRKEGQKKWISIQLAGI
jgi:hypothetical protein